MLGIFQLYLRQIASLNSCILRSYPRDLIGGTESQDPEPFSLERSNALYNLVNSVLVVVTGFLKLRPPYLIGNAKILLSISETVLPIKAGIKVSRMTSSKG